jgi:hypothetical protein
MKSVDGGASFSWASNGINGVMVGGGFNFNTQNPTVLYFGFQDYNGAISSNSGKTWQFINLSKHAYDPDHWGWVYGGYARDTKVMLGGNKPHNSGDYSLCITFDGGHQTQTKVDKLGGLKVSYGDPSNPNVLFCWDHWSSDSGQNWSKMADCDGVLTHHSLTKHLYGANGRKVVKSSDQGATWSKVIELPGGVSDVALDEKNDRLWIVADRKLYRCDAPAYQPSVVDGVGACPAQSVAVDPSNPALVYCVGSAGTWRKSNHSVMHSRDGGKSWVSPVNRTDLGFDGSNCAEWVRVHPVSEKAYVSTNCFGVWVFTPNR